MAQLFAVKRLQNTHGSGDLVIPILPVWRGGSAVESDGLLCGAKPCGAGAR